MMFYYMMLLLGLLIKNDFPLNPNKPDNTLYHIGKKVEACSQELGRGGGVLFSSKARGAEGYPLYASKPL